jgi:hypothetical protein
MTLRCYYSVSKRSNLRCEKTNRLLFWRLFKVDQVRFDYFGRSDNQFIIRSIQPSKSVKSAFVHFFATNKKMHESHKINFFVCKSGAERRRTKWDQVWLCLCEIRMRDILLQNCLVSEISNQDFCFTMNKVFELTLLFHCLTRSLNLKLKQISILSTKVY